MRSVAAYIADSRPRISRVNAWITRARSVSLPRRFPIAYKLASVFTAIITVGMAIVGWVVATDQAALLERQMISAGHTVAKQLAQVAKEPVLADDGLTLKVIVNHLHAQQGLLAVALYTDEVQPIAEAGITPDADLVSSHAGKGGMLLYSKIGDEGSEPVTVMASLSPMIVDGVTVGYALIGVDRSIVDAAKQQTIRTVALATLLFVFIGSLVSLALGKRLTRPIHDIIRISSAISAGNYAARFASQRNDELGDLMNAMNAMTEGLAQKERVEQTLSRYVAPQVAREVLRDAAPAAMAARTVHASVLFADVAGFTALAERMRADEITSVLNEYFGYIAPLVDACDGHIDKYIGDCVMAVFGVPESDALHAQHAVECATLIQYLVETLNTRRRARGLPILLFHIGINSGAMVAGNIGAADRMDYTVMGQEVNLASRVSALAQPGQILLTDNTYDALSKTGPVHCRQHARITLRGTTRPLSTFSVDLDSAAHHGFIESRVGQLFQHLDAVL